MQGPKKSDFNVSSAYVSKSDMESSFPVDAVRGRQKGEGGVFGGGHDVKGGYLLSIKLILVGVRSQVHASGF